MFFFLGISGANQGRVEWHSEPLYGRNITGYNSPTATFKIPQRPSYKQRREKKKKYSFNDNCDILKALSISSVIPF